MGCLSRRFLNLIVNERMPSVTSLCSIDLRRHQLFYPPETPPPAAALEVGSMALEVEPLMLPTPTFSFRASRRGCLPVTDRKVLCTDNHKHAFLYDAATRHVVTMPTRRGFKWKPVSVFVPSAGDSDNDGGDPDGTLYVMETWPDHGAKRREPEYDQFEAFVYRRTSRSSPAKSWHSQLLPPLPHLHNPKYWRVNAGITSYAVFGGGSHICVSLRPSHHLGSEALGKKKSEVAGTYCLDTASHTWSKVGDWTLPFVGKVEYVPELKLWFGISTSVSRNGQLAAADLSSAMDSEPQLVGVWEEIGGAAMERYDGLGLLIRCPDPKLAHLGSGRFCIARFFASDDGIPSSERFAVLTGVEVTPPQVHGGGSRDDGGEAKLQIIRHKSRRLPSGTIIDAVF